MFLLFFNIKFHGLFHFNFRIFLPFLHSTFLYQSYNYIKLDLIQDGGPPLIQSKKPSINLL